MKQRKTPRVPRSRTAPRWMHDHTDPERQWPAYGNGWFLTIARVEPHFDSIGRQDGLVLEFMQPDYPPMIVPTRLVTPEVRPAHHVVMDEAGNKRFYR